MSGETKGWTEKTEALLENWSKQTTINEREHRKRGSRSGNIYFALGVLLAFMQTVSVIALFNVLVGNGDNDSIILSTILETISLVAQVIDRFYNFGSSSEKYHDAAKEFNALARLIDSTLTLSRKDRDNAREFLLSIRQQFDSIQDNSPNLPNNKVIHKLELRIYKDPEQAKGLHISGPINLDGSSSTSPPPRPENTESVKLPRLNGAKNPRSIDSDENFISNAQRHKFANRFARSKSFTNKEKGKLNHNLNDLNYQLERMEQHGEDLGHNTTLESTSSTSSYESESPV